MKRIKLKLTGYELKLMLGIIANLMNETEEFIRTSTFAIIYLWLKKVLPKYAMQNIKDYEQISLSLDYAQAIALWEFFNQFPLIQNPITENTIRMIVFKLDEKLVNLKNDFYKYSEQTQQNFLPKTSKILGK